MPVARVSDEDFIRMWKETPSAAKMAKRLGTESPIVHRRRRRLESKYGIELTAKEDAPVIYRHSQQAGHDFQNGVALVFSDAHFWPGIDTTAYRAFLQFTEDLSPKTIICNGDAFDGASISRHPPIGWESLPTVQEELDAVESHLTRIEDRTKARLFWTLGNHDSRYETRLAQVAPEYRGVHKFHLKDHFPKWEPCWTAWVNDVVFKHRFKGGIHAAWNNTLWAGKSIVTGHDHNLWYRAFRDYNGIRYGIDTGTLAEVEGPQFVDYTEGNPKAWNSGFFVLTFSGGKLLQPEMVIVVAEDRVQFRGKEIKV